MCIRFTPLLLCGALLHPSFFPGSSGAVQQEIKQSVFLYSSWLPCGQVLYKLDRSGHGEEVALEDLPSVREINLVGFSHDMLLQVG